MGRYAPLARAGTDGDICGLTSRLRQACMKAGLDEAARVPRLYVHP